MAPSSGCRSAGFPFTPLMSPRLCRCPSVCPHLQLHLQLVSLFFSPPVRLRGRFCSYLIHKLRGVPRLRFEFVCFFITGHLRERAINQEPELLFLNGDPRKWLSSLSLADSRSEIGRFGKLHFHWQLCQLEVFLNEKT